MPPPDSLTHCERQTLVTPSTTAAAFPVACPQNVIINFGYTHFFVISFPGVSVIAWVVCYLTQIGDCFMMINGCRRPMPVAQATVGSWIKYMGVYARIAVFTNGGMFALNTE